MMFGRAVAVLLDATQPYPMVADAERYMRVFLTEAFNSVVRRPTHMHSNMHMRMYVHALAMYTVAHAAHTRACCVRHTLTHTARSNAHARAQAGIVMQSPDEDARAAARDLLAALVMQCARAPPLPCPDVRAGCP